MNSHAQLLERAMFEKIDQSYFVIKLFPEEGICIIWGNFLLSYDTGCLKKESHLHQLHQLWVILHHQCPPVLSGISVGFLPRPA